MFVGFSDPTASAGNVNAFWEIAMGSHGVGKFALAIDRLELFPCAAGVLVADFLEPNPKVWFDVLEDRKPGNSTEMLDVYELYSTVVRASFRHV